MNRREALSEFIETRTDALAAWNELIFEHEMDGTIPTWPSYETARLIRGEIRRQLDEAAKGRVPRSRLGPLLAQLTNEQNAQPIA